MITPNQAGQQVAHAIEAHIAATGVTRKHVYTSANMSRDTFDRKLRNGETLTIDQVIRIAEALRLPVARLFEPIVNASAPTASEGVLAA